MSVTLSPQALSNPRAVSLVAIVIVIVVVAWPQAGGLLVMYRDAVGLASALIGIAAAGRLCSGRRAGGAS